MSTGTVTPVTPPPRAAGLPPSSALARLRRFTRAEYHKLGEVGVIGPDERVELLDGLVVEKPMKGPPHVAVNRRIAAHVPQQGYRTT